ncbi:MAG TPA: alpha/beta hydrolase [Pseudolabrys sp.]
MSVFVLASGAWCGGWLWKRVRDRLTAKGHQVFTPTLTGLAERSHLLSRDVGLATHIDDIANLLIWEELNDVVLVGHSYSGVVVRHVADRMPDRIRTLIYLDAFVPEDGKCLMDYQPDGGDRIRVAAASQGEGWKVPPMPPSILGVNAADGAWMERQYTMHPLSTLTTPAKITGACDRVRSIGYVAARGWQSHVASFYEVAGDRGWWRSELQCGHIPMLDEPDELTELLLQRA